MSTRGYPLNALFLLLATCGNVTALAALAVRGNAVAPHVILASVGIGILTLAAAGALIGLFHYERLRGAGLGSITGAMLGAGAGPLLFIKPTQVAEAAFLYVAGAIILLLMGIASYHR